MSKFLYSLAYRFGRVAGICKRKMRIVRKQYVNGVCDTDPESSLNRLMSEW